MGLFDRWRTRTDPDVERHRRNEPRQPSSDIVKVPKPTYGEGPRVRAFGGEVVVHYSAEPRYQDGEMVQYQWTEYRLHCTGAGGDNPYVARYSYGTEVLEDAGDWAIVRVTRSGPFPSLRDEMIAPHGGRPTG